MKIHILAHNGAIIGPATHIKTPYTIAVPYFADREKAKRFAKDQATRVNGPIELLSIEADVVTLVDDPAPVATR